VLLTFKCWQSLRTGDRLPIRVGAVLNLGTDQCTLFFSNDCVPKGGNLIATVLLEQLRAIKFSGSPSASAQTLYLQFDGGSENINLYDAQMSCCYH